jgi:flagellin
MSLSIQTNVTAMQTVYDMQTNDTAESTAIQQLSSGYKINTSADDPAGEAISQNLEAQVEGLGQATNNANDAINLVKTANGALTQVQSLLLDIREKALDAANTGANDTSSAQDDQTQINQDIAALNRISSQTTFGNKNLLDGSNGMSATVEDSTDISGASIAPTDTSLVDGNANLTVTQAATEATVTGSDTSLTLTSTVSNAGTISVNGQNIQVASTDTVGDVIDNINTLTSTTGVTASLSSGGSLVLTQGSYGSANSISYTETADVFNGGTSASVTGLDAQGYITQGTTTTDFNSGSGNVLKDSAGDTITLQTSTTAGTYNNALTISGSPLTFQIGADAGQTVSFSMTSCAAGTLGSSTTGYVSGIDVTSSAGAQSAIKVIDAAIDQVSTQQAGLGAMQNGIQFTVNSLQTAEENNSASESTIKDTNMASEMVSFTQAQILVQASTAMLSQANSEPQAILKLIQNG